MSELQMGLLALGVAVVVGVIGLNKWQELKHRKAARGFESGHEDVLLSGRVASAVPVMAQAAESADRVDPVWQEGEESLGPAVVRSDPPRASGAPGAAPALDERIDFIAELALEAQSSGEDLALLSGQLQDGRYVACDGFNRDAQAWEAPVAGSAYERVRFGLQLTDRSGPIREAELAAFQRAVETLAAARNAQVTWTGARNPLENAAELDAFCAEVDVRIGISLVAGANFAETKFRGLAEANGFMREDDGIFRRRDDNGLELLSLRQSAPAAVSLLMDVPRVPRDAAAFGLMAHCARTLAKGLDAKIVDDNQRVLDDAMLARIGQGIAGIHGRMEAAGMPAGGALALRLFA